METIIYKQHNFLTFLESEEQILRATKLAKTMWTAHTDVSSMIVNWASPKGRKPYNDYNPMKTTRMKKHRADSELSLNTR